MPPILPSNNFFLNFCALKPYQISKVAAVALACFHFLETQFSCTWTMARNLAIFCSTSTLLAEAAFRTQNKDPSPNWFDPSQIHPQFAKEILSKFLISLLIFFIGLKLNKIPQIAISQTLGTRGDFRLTAVIATHVVNTIVFKGFLQERAEDFFTLIRRILPIEHPDKYAEGISNALFTAFLIAQQKVLSSSDKFYALFFVISEFINPILKNETTEEENKIVPPSLLSQIANSSSAAAGLLAARHLMGRP
jgi:hypothetical protein